MKKRVISTLCAAAMLANMVPYAAFADDAQATPETAAEAVEQATEVEAKQYLAPKASDVPGCEYDVTISDANGDGYISAGEVVTVSIDLTMSDRSTTLGAEESIWAAQVDIDYDRTVLTTNGKAWYTFGEEWSEYGCSGSNTGPGDPDEGESDRVARFIIEGPSDLVVVFPSDKIHVVTASFVALTDLPSAQGVVKVDVPAFTQSISFGGVNGMNERYATPTVKQTAALKIDTVAPTITMPSDFGTDNTYYYGPVEFTVADGDEGSGVASVTLGETALTATSGKYSASGSGTVTATDARGNSATYALTIDDSLYQAAAAALKTVPSHVRYSDKDAIMAIKAKCKLVEDVDATAYGKLDSDDYQDLVDAISDIEVYEYDINTLNAELKTKLENITISPANVAVVEEMRGKVDALCTEAKGIKTSDLSNYSLLTDAETKMASLSADLDAIKATIAALPAKADVVFGSKTAIEKARADYKAMQDKYNNPDFLTATELTKLTEAEAALAQLNTDRAALAQKVEDAVLTVDLATANIQIIADLRAEVDAMNAKGAAFTATELKNLTDAETALATLKEQLDAAKALLAALPAKDDVMYTDKQKIADAEAAMDAIVAKHGTFTDAEKAKLTNAKAGLAAIETSITAAKDLITALPAKMTNSAADQAKITAIETAFTALAAKGVVASTDISNYTAYTTKKAAMEAAIAAVKAVEDAIDALPAAADVTFENKADIDAAVTAKDALDPDFVVNADKATKLTDVKDAMDDIIGWRSDLVDLIAAETFTIDLDAESKQKILEAREDVDEFAAQYKTTFTAVELKKLTDAETAMKALEDESAAVHAAIAALPAAADVQYGASSKAAIDKVKADITAMEAKEDTFTDAEKAKVKAAEDAYEAIVTGITEVQGLINALPATVTDADIDKITTIKNKLENLESKGVTKNDIGAALYRKYEDAAAAVQAAIAAIDDVQAKIDALPAVAALKLTDEPAIAAAQAALKTLEDGGLHVSDDRATKLTNLSTALTALKAARTALVNKVATTEYTIDLAVASSQTITDLRAEVNTFATEKGTTFTAEELAKLTEAEAAMATLKEQFEAAKALLAALPAEADVMYTDKAKIDAAAAAKTTMEGKHGVFDEALTAKLTGAQDGYNEILTAKTAAETAIAGLPTTVKDTDKAAIDAVTAKIKALTDKKVPTADIAGYAKYTAAVAALKVAQDEVKAAADKVAALPAAADVKFGDESAIAAAAAALEALQDKGMDLSEEQKAKLTSAQGALTTLKNDRAALVNEIAESAYTVDLSTAASGALTAARAKVDALNTKGAAFTAAELKKLTDAEGAMKALKDESKKLHDDIAALPARDKVTYADVNTYSDILTRIEKMTEKGDAFTAAEQAKVDAVKNGLADIEAMRTALANKLKALKSGVSYADLKTLEAIQAEVKTLQDRKVAFTKDNVGTEAWSAWEGFTEALDEMQKIIEQLNAEMVTDMKGWKYNSSRAEFTAVRAKMDAAATKYSVPAAELKTVFTEYDADIKKDAAAEEVKAEMTKNLALLSKGVQLGDKATVEAMSTLLAKYGNDFAFTAEDYKDILGEKSYNAYLAAVETLAKLETPQTNPDNGNDSGSTPAATAAPAAPATTSTGNTHYIVCEACGHHDWTPYMGGYKCTNCGHLRGTTGVAATTATKVGATIPKTDDSMNVTLIVALLLLSGCGLGYGLYKKKKN